MWPHRAGTIRSELWKLWWSSSSCYGRDLDVFSLASFAASQCPPQGKPVAAGLIRWQRVDLTCITPSFTVSPCWSCAILTVYTCFSLHNNSRNPFVIILPERDHVSSHRLIELNCWRTTDPFRELAFQLTCFKDKRKVNTLCTLTGFFFEAHH